jgi:DNA-binding winged helix-turn-helix (wHTH) protein
VMARFGPFVLDSEQRQLTRGDVDIHLTPKAFDLLVLLIEEAPRVIRKQELHERLWPGTFVSDATLVALVKHLRRALSDRDTGTPIIRTAHRVGYAFAVPLEGVGSGFAVVSHWIIAGGRRIALVERESVIGRDPVAAVHLDAGGVSRRHARIVVEGSSARLEDLGSKNGTALRGELITAATALRDGDEITVGPVSIVYRRSERGVSTETTTRAPSRGRSR